MGVFIRDKKYRQRGTGIKVADPRQDCYFDPANEGLVEVNYRQVIDRLLAHPNDFEVAWDKHGIHFDASGKVMENGHATTTGNFTEATVIVSPPMTLPVKSKRGRKKG